MRGFRLPVFRRYQEVYTRYQRFAPAGFFLAGFLFDVFSLGRVDDWLTLLQQAIYLLLCGTLVGVETLEQFRTVTPPRWLTRVWHYRLEATHFLLGSLLSSYTLFYFKSASLVSSIFFMSFL